MDQHQYSVTIGKCFVKKRLATPRLSKSGKRVIETVTVPIIVRRLFLFGDFVNTRQFRCIPVLRGGTLSFSISYLAEPKKPLWTMPALRPQAEQGVTWKRWASMREREFSAWLARVLGSERAMRALSELQGTAAGKGAACVTAPIYEYSDHKYTLNGDLQQPSPQCTETGGKEMANDSHSQHEGQVAMRTVHNRTPDEFWHGILTRVDQAASVAAARLIRKMPDGISDELLARLMECASDVMAEEFGEVLEHLQQVFKAAIAAIERDLRKPVHGR